MRYTIGSCPTGYVALRATSPASHYQRQSALERRARGLPDLECVPLCSDPPAEEIRAVEIGLGSSSFLPRHFEVQQAFLRMHFGASASVRDDACVDPIQGAGLRDGFHGFEKGGDLEVVLRTGEAVDGFGEDKVADDAKSGELSRCQPGVSSPGGLFRHLHSNHCVISTGSTQVP
jgi:hypothetical protein